MKINLDELEKEKEINKVQRMKFVEFWAEYVKTHLDKEWSEQQKVVIDSQMS